MFYLGISAYYHDASVALLDSDGNLIDFKKEEWLSRVKGDKSFPRQSLLEMIKNHDLSEKNLTLKPFTINIPKITSGLNGIINVAAKKQDMNKPKYPKSVKYSILILNLCYIKIIL